MEQGSFIAVEVFCSHHKIEPSFIESLQSIGLVEIVVRDDRPCIEATQVAQLEKYVRLHYDLDINLEGLEAITHLLARVQNMQDEIETLRGRLRFYESE